MPHLLTIVDIDCHLNRKDDYSGLRGLPDEITREQSLRRPAFDTGIHHAMPDDKSTSSRLL